jgi:hypothetical protein
VDVKTKPKEKALVVDHPGLHFIHLPYAYPVGGKHYGLTAALRTKAICNTATAGPVVAFDVGLAFCSPSEPKGYRGEKGKREALKRLGEPRKRVHLMLPLAEIMKGKLEKVLLKQIDVLFPPNVLPTGLLDMAEDFGFPTQLLYHRHYHRNDKR